MIVSRELLYSLLQSCTKKKDHAGGRQVHSLLICNGLDSVPVLGNHLIRLFAASGSLLEAALAFCRVDNPTIHTWHAVISAHASLEKHDRAVHLYHLMQSSGVEPDKFILSSVLKACGGLACILPGRLIHCQILERMPELGTDVFVGSSLIDMYAKCSSLKDARVIFETLPRRNIVSWSAMISGYVDNEQGLSALRLLEDMQDEGIKADAFMLSCALKVCGNMGTVWLGRQINDDVVRSDYLSDRVVANTLVDMYAKCGSLEEARRVLETLQGRNVATWGAMIAGYAQHGLSELARECFEEMLAQGLRPDSGIYTSILTAFCHAGQLQAGYSFFKSMVNDHRLAPDICHFNCLVDLLGRAGWLKEAQDIAKLMPGSSDIKRWRSLLTACRSYGDIQLGRQCFNASIELNPHNSAGYVLMSQMCSHGNDSANFKVIEDLKRYSCAWKKPGKAWIAMKYHVHEFTVADKSLPYSCKMYAKLFRVLTKLRRVGYIPESSFSFLSLSADKMTDTPLESNQRLTIPLSFQFSCT